MATDFKTDNKTAKAKLDHMEFVFTVCGDVYSHLGKLSVSIRTDCTHAL